MSYEYYEHLIQIDEVTRDLRVYRVDATGQKTLFTSRQLPVGPGWNDAVGNFARELGENLLLDSPSARRLLQL